MAMTTHKDTGFYKQILTIALPIALQNLVTYLTSMMDSIMLGRADDTGTLLSASSQANQPFFILSMVCFGLSGAGQRSDVVAGRDAAGRYFGPYHLQCG